ncbi:prolyl oligopeptidase family serine peptidase [candidate division KSB1 bacterium]
MYTGRTSRLFIRMVCTAAFLLAIVSTSSHAQISQNKTAFTTHDALNVKSLSVQSITKDGRYVAGTIRMQRNRLNTQHFRYGDPTYISPSLVEVVVIDTETKEQRSLFEEPVQARSLTWSPDGAILAFFLLKNDNYILHTYDLERKRIREIELKSDKSIASNSSLEWTEDGSAVLIALRENGWAEKAKAAFKEATVGPVIVYDSSKPFLKWDELRNMSALQIPARVIIDNREVTELLEEGRYGSIGQAKDGSFITYVQTYPIKTSYTRRDGTEYELFLLNLDGDTEPKSLKERSEERISVRWNPDNTLFAWAEKGDILVQSVFEEEPRNLTKDKIEPEGDDTTKVRFSVMRWSPDGTRLLAGTEKAYWLIHQESGDIEKVYDLPEDSETAPDRSVNDWSPDGRYLYMTYSAKDKWERGLTRYDLQSRQMTSLVMDSNLYGGWRMSEDGEKFLYNFSDGDMPNELYMTDKDFRTKTRLTDLNPWMSNKKLSRSELVKYLDIDGDELNGILYYPVDYDPSQKYPLVCEVYETFFNNGFNVNMNILTSAGFFGFRPSVKLNIGFPGESWLKGVTAGVNKLIERGMIDPKKVGIQGQSYGGYAVSLIITQTNRFAAAVNVSGKVNIISFLGDSPRIGTRNYAAAEVGQDRIGQTLWEAPIKYLRHSAVLDVDRVETPLLLLTGEGDWNVPATNTREMYYAMRRLDKEVVWVNYYNGGHGAGRASTEPDFHDHWNRIIEWYRTHFEKADEKDAK